MNSSAEVPTGAPGTVVPPMRCATEGPIKTETPVDRGRGAEEQAPCCAASVAPASGSFLFTLPLAPGVVGASGIIEGAFPTEQAAACTETDSTKANFEGAANREVDGARDKRGFVRSLVPAESPPESRVSTSGAFCCVPAATVESSNTAWSPVDCEGEAKEKGARGAELTVFTFAGTPAEVRPCAKTIMVCCPQPTVQTCGQTGRTGGPRRPCPISMSPQVFGEKADS